MKAAINMDEIAEQGTALLTQGNANREVWLWHRRLGHPSMGYLEKKFLSLVKI